MTRKITSSKDGAATAEAENFRRVQAYKQVFGGNSTRDEGEIVLSHLCRAFGFFEPPTLDEWMKKHKTAVGFELNCAIHAARLEPIRVILNHLDLDDDVMIALQRAAKR